ncbi:MAG: metalloregulator ArsR/SmtB family transcription factor [Acidobacteriota bacterium]|nr:metalloregulator ArsR/SmtB family transcription factor [Acidobacteriota bacterium]
MNNKTFLPDLEIFFMALADKTRLRLLNLMRESEVSVGLLVDILGESQPKVSRHLASLRSAGIVEARRDGKWIHYKITTPADDFAARILSNTLEWLYSQEEMRAEYKRFSGNFMSSNNNELKNQSRSRDISDKSNTKENHKQGLEIYLL